MKHLSIFIALLFIFIINQSVFSQRNDTMKMRQSPPIRVIIVNTGNEMEEIAHPFFTHMGMPEGVGSFNLRLAGLLTRREGHKAGDFAFHFETGLSEFVGVHIRNDDFLNRQFTELMFQFAALRSKSGESGFSPLIEFEFPTKSGAEKRVNTLVGFSTALMGRWNALNQVIHYNPREDMVDGSVSFVLRYNRRLFQVLEVLGEAKPGEKPIINILGGLKFRVGRNLLVGLGFQTPVTNNKDFSWQLIFQPDIEWGKMK